MSEAPVFDYTCSQCGARETFQLVRMEGGPLPPQRPVPEFDFTCSQCGATDTYQLVKKP
jgi:predicted nucleic acid-binding Zn ribbon protein